MSIEKQARRALRRMVFYRLLGDIVEIAYDLAKAVVSVIDVVARLSDKLSTTVFYLELDAAREYRLLTGVDMGVATDNEHRYMGTRAGAFEAAVSEFDGDDRD